MKMIDDALFNTSVTVVFVGDKTANKKFINYDIEQSIDRGGGIVNIQIHHLESQDKETESLGSIPKLLPDHGFMVYKYVDHERLANKIEGAAIAAGK